MAFVTKNEGHYGGVTVLFKVARPFYLQSHDDCRPRQADDKKGV